MNKLFWIVLLSALSANQAARYTDCEITPTVEHAAVRVEDDEDVVVATYTCERGFKLKGDDRIYCDLNTDEWMDDPPVCVPVEQAASGSGGTSDPDGGGPGTQQPETDTRTRKKGQDIVEDGAISREFASKLDMSCIGNRVKAPSIDNGRVIKYDRRQKDGIIFLAAFYSCNKNYELEDTNQSTMYCSKQTWIGNLPVCIMTEENYSDYGEEDYGDEDEEEDYENGNGNNGNGNGNGDENGKHSHHNNEESNHIVEVHPEHHEIEESSHHEGSQHTNAEDHSKHDQDYKITHGSEEHSSHHREEHHRHQHQEENYDHRQSEHEHHTTTEYPSRVEETESSTHHHYSGTTNSAEEQESVHHVGHTTYEESHGHSAQGAEVNQGGEDHRSHTAVESSYDRETTSHVEENGGHHVDNEEEDEEDEDEGYDEERRNEVRPEYTSHEDSEDNEILTTTTTAAPTTEHTRYFNESCGHERGGCDHECRLVYDSYEAEPRVQCSCYSGFTLDPHGLKQCFDIDECQLNNGGCEQICINVPGSFECLCDSGLQIDTVTGNTCVDINECLLRNGHGPCQDTCHNTHGSYTCSCDGLSGTKLSQDGHTCEDDGLCANNNGGCSHKCLTTLGRVFCLCPEGYQLTDDWKTCQDIDECQNPEIFASCRFGCENLPGTYRCVDDPYKTDETENEISERKETVEKSEDHYEEEQKRISENSASPPEHKEECHDGYRRNEHGACVDIDECAEGITGCQYCVNQEGGFECTCPDGYELTEDERTCIDINECEEYTRLEGDESNDAAYAICSHECINIPGSFRCTCPENFHLHSDFRTCIRDYCEDLLNLELNKTRCSHSCEDGSEGFVCTCPQGHVLDTDFKNCISVDVCSKGDGHVLCRPGTCVSDGEHHTCICPSGYESKERRCHDIDECLSGTHKCSHYCKNNEGSYECSCPPGLLLSPQDYETCIDINECQEHPDVCGSLLCENTQGSYRCVCPQGQELQPDGSCGRFDACGVHNGGCSHMCSSHNGYAECDCPSDMTLSGDGRTCIEFNPCLHNNGGCTQVCDPKIVGHCSCNTGYELHPDGKTCLDLDECQYNNGGCSHICTNLPGLYECSCKKGFEMHHGSCVDIDECVMGSHSCPTQGACVNTEGGYVCDDCPAGFAFAVESNNCQDIDECFLHNGNCSHICINLQGSYHCSCPAGQVLSSDGMTCDFVNECELNNGGCSHECHHSHGVTSCSCPAGYHLDDSFKNCVDIDECQTNNGGCSHVCENLVGRFACLCPTGYVLDSNGHSCSDVDECIENNGNCSNICINLLGSYSCACESGFELQDDMHTCLDVNECLLNLYDCSHSCINNPGGYDCSCPPGLKLGRDKLICHDINECEETYNGGCSDRCINTHGSFYCECPGGHSLASDNRTCINTDECANSGKKCSHDCKNIVGGYQCLCPYGYQLAEDQVTCVDVNECEVLADKGGCSHGCENAEGSYICTCPKGWKLAEDQRTCQDIDECLHNNGGCSTYCINLDGGFKCECHNGDRLGRDKKTCISSDPCLNDNGGCDHICKKKDRGVQCACRAGFILDSNDNRTCVDFDECRYENVCPQACFNTIGSFECKCHPGYNEDHRGHCIDINECDYLNGGCSPMGNCVNLPGSFKCTCPNGFKLAADRKTCLEIQDRCEPLKAPVHGEVHCTRSRHKTQLFYKTKCSVWCHKGYRLHGPSIRHCNGTGHWDDYENFCVPQTCPRLPKPEHGAILPTKCIHGTIQTGERCVLHCPAGYIPAGKRAAICNADQTWSTNSSLSCIPITSEGPAVFKPRIKCPQDTILILQKGQTTVHIRLEQPKTNVDYYKYVDSHPKWAKHLEAHLGVGVHVLTFRARSPHSNLNAICRSVITIKEPKPPTVIYCPQPFEVQLGLNEVSRSITWKEPIFEPHSPLKQIYKSKVSGDRLGPGIHDVVYIATDRDGQSSRCEFKIAVRGSYPRASAQYGIHRTEVHAGYEANRLENHESYLLCPGKQAMKIETNYPVHVPIGCFIKNVSVTPLMQQHRRRHQRVYNNNVLRHYSSWNDPFLEKKAHSLYRRKVVKAIGKI